MTAFCIAKSFSSSLILMYFSTLGREAFTQSPSLSFLRIYTTSDHKNSVTLSIAIPRRCDCAVTGCIIIWFVKTKKAVSGPDEEDMDVHHVRLRRACEEEVSDGLEE